MSTEYTDDFVKKFMTEGEVAPDADTNDAVDASAGGLSQEILKEQIVLALRTVYDPEIPVNVYDLGLIYNVDVDDKGMANVTMTLTNPGCPVAHTFPGQIENTVREVEGVSDACVELVWDPPWTKELMSESARLELGIF